MSENELNQLIDPTEYAAIRKYDPHPNFKAYIIGQEGESHGRLVGMGKIASQWLRSAIEKITDVLKIGTKIFHGHTETIGHEGRQPIGFVAGKALKTIGNKLSSIAVMYFYPQYKDLPLDVASIEAIVKVPQDLNEGMTVVDADVKEITGVALANSALVKPAFPGAVKLAELQAYIETYHGGIETMTIDEIKQFISENRTRPSDLFSLGVISEDPLIKSYIRDEKSSEYHARKRNLDEFEKERDDLRKESGELKKKLEVQTKITLKIQAEGKLDTISEQRKLTPKQKAFIKTDLDKFEPTEAAALDGDFNRFIDSKLDDFDKKIAALGLKKEDLLKDKTDPQAEVKDTGVGAGDEKTTPDDENDMTDPANNDQIPDY